MHRSIAVAFCSVALCVPAVAEAATIAFTGRIVATSVPFGPCPVGGGGTTRLGDGVGASMADGFSNLGAFEPVQGHCISAPVNGVRPLYNGDFTWTFADGGVLAGAYAGSIFATNNPLIFNPVATFAVTGGTGRFLGASGQLAGNALVFQFSTPFRIEWDIAGPLDAPAIPEPGTWAMMIAGFGVVGAAMRRGERKTVIA